MAIVIKGAGYSFTRPSIQSLIDARTGFALRYVGGDPEKTIDSAEFTALCAAHIPLVLVHETTAEWMLGGHDAGIAGAQLARGDMAAAGIPLTVPVYCAADFDVQESQTDDVLAAGAAFASIHGDSRTGVYGGLRIVTAAADAGARTFQTSAWSTREGQGLVWDSRAVLRQAGQYTLGGVTVDQDTAMAFDFGQYTPPPPPWPGRVFSYAYGAPEIHGDDVLTWQRRMQARGWKITPDGWYGPQSADVCEAFQTEFHVNPAPGLGIDREVGPRTWAAAYTIPITI